MSQVPLKDIKDELWNHLTGDRPRQEQLKALSKMPDSELLIRAMYLSLEDDIEKGKKKMKEEAWMKKVRAITHGRPVDDPDEEEDCYMEDIASLVGADYCDGRVSFGLRNTSEKSPNPFNVNNLVVSSSNRYWDSKDQHMVRLDPSLLPLITTGLKSLRDQCLISTTPFPEDEEEEEGDEQEAGEEQEEAEEHFDFGKFTLDDIAIAEFEAFKEAWKKDSTSPLPSISYVKKILVERLSTSSDSMPPSVINVGMRDHSMLVQRFKTWKADSMMKEKKNWGGDDFEDELMDVRIKEEPFEHEGILYIKRTRIYPGANGEVSSKILYRDCTGSEVIVGVPELRDGSYSMCFLNDDTEYGHDIRKEYIS